MITAGLLRATSARLLICALVIGGASAGCSDAVAPPEAQVAVFQVLGGDGQSARAGEQLPNPLMVAVLDHQQRPVAGVTVSFTVQQGSGTISPQEVVTDASGIARSRWTLGGAGSHQVTASVRNWEGRTLTALFTATATP